VKSPQFSTWIKETIFSSWGGYYQSQGLVYKDQSSNDCGPTCVAMALNIFSSFNGSDREIGKNQIIQQIRSHFWERIPGWVPSIGGATSPWGVVDAFNHSAAQLGLNACAIRLSHANWDAISSNVEQGNLVSPLRFWQTGGGHWSLLIGISTDKRSIFLLDPNPFLAQLSPVQKVQIINRVQFIEDWSRQPSWAKLLNIKNELVIFSATDK